MFRITKIKKTHTHKFTVFLIYLSFRHLSYIRKFFKKNLIFSLSPLFPFSVSSHLETAALLWGRILPVLQSRYAAPRQDNSNAKSYQHSYRKYLQTCSP